MTQAKVGNTVQVHYTGKLDNGTVFESSVGGDPLQFTLGQGGVLPAFENAVLGMEAGAQKTARIASEDAYGPHRDDMLMVIGRQQIPDHIQPEIGQQLELRKSDGQPVAVRVAEVSQDKVVLDANHPLSGQDLIFDIQLVSIA